MSPNRPHRNRVRHYDDPTHFHEPTFSCYRPMPLLTSDLRRTTRRSHPPRTSATSAVRPLLAFVKKKAPLSEPLYPLRCYHRQRTIRSSNHYSSFDPQSPQSPRLGRIDAQRVGRVLAGQFRSRQFCLLLRAVCRRARQNGCGKAQSQAGGDDSYFLSNEHILVSLSERDVQFLSNAVISP